MVTQRAQLNERGFVLVELMIALVLLTLLASLVMLGMNTISNSADDATDRANDDTCRTAIAAYRVDNDDASPSTDADLATYVAGGATPDCLP